MNLWSKFTYQSHTSTT